MNPPDRSLAAADAALDALITVVARAMAKRHLATRAAPAAETADPPAVPVTEPLAREAPPCPRSTASDG